MAFLLSRRPWRLRSAVPPYRPAAAAAAASFLDPSPTAGAVLAKRCFAARCSGKLYAVPAALLQDAAASAAVMAGAHSLVLAFDGLSERNLIEQNLSRKVVHILSGLLFMCSWPVFSSAPEARYFAALVPLANGIKLLAHGFRLVNDEGLIKSITRDGKPEELLRGPLYYVMTLMACALLFWRESPIGVASLSIMSAGDGFADIIGRRYGALKLPFNRQKSWAGSLSMFGFGFVTSIMMLYYFSLLGCLHVEWRTAVEKVAVVSLVSAVVESLPIAEAVDDNISVPLASILVALLVFG